jgi:hypothetical protein
MMIIGKLYRMWMDDSNILHVALRPTDYLADWVFNFRRYLKADQQFLGEKQLQRFTIWTNSQVVDPTIELDSEHITAAGDTVLTWANNATYKFIKVTYGSGNVDGAISAIDMANTSATVTVTGSTVDITVYIYGNEFQSTDPTYLGEAVNAANLLANNGFRYREINPLIKDDTEADDTCENFITEFGDPAYNVMVFESFLNPLNEMNDQALLVSEDFFEDSLYETTEINYNMRDETNKRTIVKLLDTGRKYTDEAPIVWNRDLYGAPSWQLDNGFILDAGHRIGATRSEILADTTYITDTGFN